MKQLIRSICCLFIFCLIAASSQAQQKMDQEYGKLIKKYTTSPEYLNDWIDHLPASSKVPSPLDYFGTIAGAADTLHTTEQIYGYFNKLAQAAPDRVKILNIGTTEGGHHNMIVFISNSKTIKNIDTYQKYLNELSDPRKISSSQAEKIINKAKPIYLFTAGLHSPETGSPEMVMELAYRLIVSKAPLMKKIRNNVIVAISPVTEPDGRDRVVEIYRWRDAHKGVTPSLTYWGNYVAHDNNRDGYGLALDLTHNFLNFYLKWHPTVMHDLHESVPLLYIFSSMGPNNPYDAPSLISTWSKMAYNAVNIMQQKGMPGVWTKGFMDDWTANYLAWIANNRNSIGLFFETFGNSIPQTVERHIPARDTTKEWFRQTPPPSKTMWSLRDNTNYMETGALAYLKYAVKNGKEMVKGFYNRSKLAIEKGKTEAPYAFVIPKHQRREAAVVQLINMLRANGIEVQQTNGTIAWPDKSVDDGAYIIRMDQPYRTLVGTLLDEQKFPSKRYSSSYDDVGWNLPYLYQVQSYKVKDSGILKKNMSLLTHNVQLNGKVTDGSSKYLLLDNSTVNQIGMFRLQLPNIPMKIAEQSFKENGQSYAPGSLVISMDGLSKDQSQQIKKKAKKLGLHLYGVSNLPDVGLHDADVPRIALVHTWIPTPQNAGWWRYAFDRLNIPYDLISTQDFKNLDPNNYDVIIMPDTRASTPLLVMGTGKAGPPVAWMKTELTPHLGTIDHTKDQRQGMTYKGVIHMIQFLHKGGVLITEANASKLPIDLGITRHIRIRRTPKLDTQGSVFEATMTDSLSPIMYGYPDTLAVYFNSPVFKADTTAGGFRDYMTPDWLKNERWQKSYPRVVMRFQKNTKKLLLSGMLKGGKELAGTPAVVDVPVGKGHVVMLANRAFWRWETQGSHALIFNILMNWNDLRVGWPERPDENKSQDSK